MGASEDDLVRRKRPKKSSASRKDASITDGLRDLRLDQAPTRNHELPSPDPVPTPQISVKQDTLSLMAKLFTAGAEGTKSVRWTQLVQALTDVGMIATQGAWSAVGFSNSHGSISLHMPHPEPVIDAFRLRGIGKRLNKWFGWTNETFVLRQRDSTDVREDDEE